MTGKKKSRPLMAQGTGQAAEKSGETVSSFDFTTSGPSGQAGKVSRFLLRGEESAISGPELARMLNVNPRTLRFLVDAERLERPICASDSGYFLPDKGNKGALELQRFLRRMDGRCRANRAVTKSARAALKAYQHSQIAGQQTFFGGGNT